MLLTLLSGVPANDGGGTVTPPIPPTPEPVMANSLAGLRIKARQLADMPSSLFVSDAECNGYINDGVSELHDLLTSLYEDYNLVETTFTLTSSQSFTLPSNFYKLRALDYQRGPGSYEPMRRYLLNERDFAMGRRYKVNGLVLTILPDDNYVGTYRLLYTPKYAVLVNDTDTVDDSYGWHELIVISAAIQMLAKEESDVTIMAARKQEMVERIKRSAVHRDASGPSTISDTRGMKNRRAVWR